MLLNMLWKLLFQYLYQAQCLLNIFTTPPPVPNIVKRNMSWFGVCDNGFLLWVFERESDDQPEIVDIDGAACCSK